MITASGLSEKAHEYLLPALETLEAQTGENSALLIHPRTKVNASGEISDAATAEALKLLIESLTQAKNE